MGEAEFLRHLKAAPATVGPWPLYASSVLDEQYDRRGRTGGATP